MSEVLVSIDGKDISSTTPTDISLDSDVNKLRVIRSGIATVTSNANSTYDYTTITLDITSTDFPTVTYMGKATVGATTQSVPSQPFIVNDYIGFDISSQIIGGNIRTYRLEVYKTASSSKYASTFNITFEYYILI